MEYKFKAALQKTIITDTEITTNFPNFHCRIDDLISVTLNPPTPPQCTRHTLSFISKNGIGQGVIKDDRLTEAKEVLNILWNKLGITGEDDARERARQAIEGVKSNELEEKNKKIYRLNYVGGHPQFSNEMVVSLSFIEDGISIASYDQFDIKYDEIESITSQNEKEVLERFTATRIALFGPFALAMKKRKISNTRYLLIECHDYTLTFIDNPEVKSLLYQNWTRHKQNHKANINTGSNLDEIKKLKELLDMGAITQEEFDTKKKELLGL